MLTARKLAFIDAYKSTGNATESARIAGYHGKHLNRVGYRLLQDVDIKRTIDEFKASRSEKYSKENFIDTAWKQFETLEDVPMARLRALELAGKALNYLKSGNDTNVNILMASDSLNIMRQSLEKRGKIVNTSQSTAPSLPTPPVNTIDIVPIEPPSADTLPNDDDVLEKKCEPGSEGGERSPSHP